MKYEEVVKVWRKGGKNELNYFFYKFICNSIRIEEMESRMNHDYRTRKKTLKDILQRE
ncbi:MULTISPECIES: hypothetical protein [Clostridium]|uniref:hypothetical protein n=1 Tax=Clostridium TaxID=1485 RepID=UPI0028FDFC76|nr:MULTISPECIES: hypothetical protein [Clostridium]MDU2896640.1 hypothetical protein [Clostridium sp.]MDU3008771.1 hypothetical protein [Clostridium sp.]MDU3038971.1 hypothetical protein [Clostridium sp.]MDU3053069.1 hypothetical protein [Clostridium sp.]MDU4659974.1 hypothetical protein [Clostridium butyricum]